MVLICLLSLVPGAVLLTAHAQTQNLTVATQTNSGSTLTGYWIEVTDTSGNVVQTGFSTATFTLSAGNYVVYVGDYGGQYFNHWSDGVSTRGHPVTIGSTPISLTAIYCGAGGCGGASFLVTSQYSGGAGLTGMYTTLSQGTTVIATGFTPASFQVTSGQTYSITVADYTNAYFTQWSNGVSSRTITVTATGSQTNLTAIYCTTQGGCSSGGGTGASITVKSSDLGTGAAVNGFYVDLRLNDNSIQSGFTPVTFSGLQTGVPYLVVVYWYGSYYFRHFSNGNLQRYEYVTLNNTAGQTNLTLNALYEQVPTAQAASLNIIAKFPNGTVIGTAYDINGYPQHTPGMYLTVTPPGSDTPFTATFTGGSILPFIFFNTETYTVSMSTGYGNVSFTRWNDTGSTDPVRAVTLNGNVTIVAIYTQS